jgi:hypothetical protein
MNPKFKIGDKVRLKTLKDKSYTMTIIDIVYLNMENPIYYLCEPSEGNIRLKDTYAEERIELVNPELRLH